MEFTEVNQLLEPGYLPIETGYFHLPNGDLHVRLLSAMYKCKGIMIDWWIGNITSNERFKMWNPKDHVKLVRDDNWKPGPWKPGQHIGASHVAEQIVGGNTVKVRMRFHEPSEFHFDTSRFKEANVGAVICGKASDLEGNPTSRLIHFVRDTDYGCEMRTLIWRFNNPPEVAGVGTISHCIAENAYLADFLPDLYAKETASA